MLLAQTHTRVVHCKLEDRLKMGTDEVFREHSGGWNRQWQKWLGLNGWVWE